MKHRIKSFGLVALMSAIGFFMTGCGNNGGGGGGGEFITLNTEVVVIGGGGAGFSAALTARELGRDVILVEQLSFTGGNTVLAGGAMNAPARRTQEDPATPQGPGAPTPSHPVFTPSNEALVNFLINFDPANLNPEVFGEVDQIANLAIPGRMEILGEWQDALRASFDAWVARGSRGHFDSQYMHKLQTWHSGDFLAYPWLVEAVYGGSDGREIFDAPGVEGRGRAYAALRWITDPPAIVGGQPTGGLGANWHSNATMIVGALWPRSQAVNLAGTTIPSGPPTAGVGFIRPQEYRFDQLGGTVLMEHRATGIVMAGERAVAITGIHPGGEFRINASHGIVIATGGFCGNMSMLVQNNPMEETLPLVPGQGQGVKWENITAFPTSNIIAAATGEGIMMAYAAGARLTQMDQIQFLPPSASIGGDLQTNTVGGQGFEDVMWIDFHGRRMVNEAGRRDALTLAGMVAVRDTGGFRAVTGPAYGGVTFGEVTDAYDDPAIVRLLAEAFLPGAPASDLDRFVTNFIAAITDYNEAVRDGRADKAGKSVQNRQLTPPWRISPIGLGPNLHHTMGGIAVDEYGQVLRRSDGQTIPGLFAAGEAAGGFHGSNRIGGNAITDIVVFGRIVGQNFADEN